MSQDKPLATLEPSEATSFFDDPGWFPVARVAALNALIPLLGPVVLIGWGRALYEEGLTGPNRLTPVVFERDLSIGQATAPGILGWPAALLAINGLRRTLVYGLAVLLRLFSDQLGFEGVVQLEELLYGASELSSLVVTALWIPWVLLLPELVRRVYQGELFPWQDPGPSFLAIKMNLDGYQKVVIATSAVLGAAWMVHSLFGWLTLLVAPLIWSVLTHFSAQWQRIVKEHGVPGTF